MSTDALLHFLRRRLAWLLCLSLLLPLAQAAGAAHALSHASGDAVDDTGKGAPHLVHCAICPLAAALSGGGVPTAPGVPPAPEAVGLSWQPSVTIAVPAAPQRLFLNRGPPSH